MSLDKVAKIKIGIGVVLIGLTALTVSFILKNVRKLANLTFDIRTIKVNTLNLKEISITIFWVIKNPSDFRFIVKNQVYDVFINGKFVKKVGAVEEIQVLSNGTSLLPTNVFLTTKELFNLGIENLEDLVTESGRKKLKLKVTGTFDIKTPLFTLRKLPFEFEDSLHNIMNY
jgi:LEA14-like dessication related protein